MLHIEIRLSLTWHKNASDSVFDECAVKYPQQLPSPIRLWLICIEPLMQVEIYIRGIQLDLCAL